MKPLLRYWHTLRYLRPIQFYGRAWFRFYRPSPNLAPAPAIRRVCAQWQAPARRDPSLIGPEQFQLLGERASLDEVGWDGPQRDKLWRYNQHYFDDLNARDNEARADWHRALMARWVRDNPPGKGSGWEPYPISLRIVNWVKWVLAGHRLSDTCLHSLAVQARWLSRRLEIHLLGNHLFANAKALLFAGLFFEGEEANWWLRKGLSILEREITEQILPDGGHFERSTMYHALVFEDLLDLINLFECFRRSLSARPLQLLPVLRERAKQMLDWLRAMRHADGEIAFFNDAALGIAPSCDELLAYAVRLGIAAISAESPGPQWLEKSGYARLELDKAVAILDLAPVGPDYLPGHAHADTLSFELSVGKCRLLVNSGTSCYGSSRERLRQRGTAAHNTVMVEGKDSSEVWGGFRVARRARPVSPRVELEGKVLRAECAHDGYRRLPGRPLHRRRWSMDQTGLVVEDELSVEGLSAQARFHFHPDVKIKSDSGGGSGCATLPSGARVEWWVENGIAHLEDSTWHPAFGVSRPNQCLVVELVGGYSRIRWHW